MRNTARLARKINLHANTTILSLRNVCQCISNSTGGSAHGCVMVFPTVRMAQMNLSVKVPVVKISSSELVTATSNDITDFLTGIFLFFSLSF